MNALQSSSCFETFRLPEVSEVCLVYKAVPVSSSISQGARGIVKTYKQRNNREGKSKLVSKICNFDRSDETMAKSGVGVSWVLLGWPVACREKRLTHDAQHIARRRSGFDLSLPRRSTAAESTHHTCPSQPNSSEGRKTRQSTQPLPLFSVSHRALLSSQLATTLGSPLLPF